MDWLLELYSNVGGGFLRDLTYLIICRILLFEFALRLGLLLQTLTSLHSPSWVIVCPLGQLSGIVTKADLGLNLKMHASSTLMPCSMLSCINARSWSSKQQVFSSLGKLNPTAVWFLLLENSFASTSVVFNGHNVAFTHWPDCRRTYPSFSQSERMHIEPDDFISSSTFALPGKESSPNNNAGGFWLFTILNSSSSLDTSWRPDSHGPWRYSW